MIQINHLLLEYGHYLCFFCVLKGSPMTTATTASKPVQPAFLQNAQAQVQADLLAVLDAQVWPEVLCDAVRHAVLQGGKRVRPALVYAACQACTGRDSLSAAARRAAVAIELIHCYSLVHDDLPCMDDDELRRGQPTVHVVYGEANALLAGDVLQSLAFEVLSGNAFADTAIPDESVRLAQVASLSRAASRMVHGQLLDLAAETKQVAERELEQIHIHKTGALIRSAVEMGAQAAGAGEDELADLDSFAYALGLAFQVQDDILDVTATTEELGKPAGSDEKLHKSTYPSLLGLAGAQVRATALHQQAIKALDRLPHSSALRQLAEFLLHRKA